MIKNSNYQENALIKTDLRTKTVNKEATTTNSSNSTRSQKPQNPYRKSGRKVELTSQQLESAQQSAQKTPEYNTGNVDSKHARPAARHNTAGQPTPEPQL
jgi:hypothetical protein